MTLTFKVIWPFQLAKRHSTSLLNTDLGQPRGEARCQKSLNLLKVLSRTEWGADRTTLSKLYHSLVRSKLDYGCIVYGSASKTALAKLDSVHNQGLRLSLGAFRSSPVESLCVEAHEPPLGIRRDKLALQYVLKLKANPENPAYDVVFNPKHQELYKNKEPATDSFGIHCKKLLKEAKIDVGEIAINSIPDVPIWDSEPVTVDFTLSKFDKSSTSSTVFKSRFNEVKQKYSDFCHIYTDGSKVEITVASAYVCPYGTRSYRLRDGCSIFTAEVEAIDKALKYVKVSSVEGFLIFSDSMSVLQAIGSQERKNPLVNRVLQTCQEILSNVKFITFCLIPSHRDIRGNEYADRAANDALSKAQPTHIELPCTDVFSCDQAALWMVFSVRLSVCPSVRLSVCLSVCPSVCLSVCPSVRLSHLFDYVPIIVSSWNFQELSHWTRVRSMQKVKVRGQRSRSERSRPKFSFPDCNSSLNSHMMMKWYI